MTSSRGFRALDAWLLVLLLALGAVGQVAADSIASGRGAGAPSRSTDRPPAAAEATTLVRPAIRVDAEACETCRVALTCQESARRDPCDGPPVETLPSERGGPRAAGASSSRTEIDRRPSITLGHLRTNGSADAHGARA